MKNLGKVFYKTTYDTPVGEIMLASDGNNLAGLWNKGQKYHGDSIIKDMATNDDLPVFKKTKEWLDNYFDGKNPPLTDLPLKPFGETPFRKMVWDILCGIPYGKTVTYGSIAKTIAAKLNKKTMSAQAVGGAVGHNPVSIIIPCHRVVGSDGGLTGYAGGLEIKVKLLELERLFIL